MKSDNAKTGSGPRGSVILSENRRPATPSGDFTIQVTQEIYAEARVINKGVPPAPSINASFTAELRRFSVAGPRFTIAPNLIQNRFPPNGSLGNYHNVLPHLTFARSTLPWERFITAKGHVANAGIEEIDAAMLRTPWMALLLFDQDELPDARGDDTTPNTLRISAPVACTLSQAKEGENWTLLPKAPAGVLAPTFRHEFSQQSGDPVSVIDVPRVLLQAILPNPDEVRLLGHASQSANVSGAPYDDDSATLICNRLPRSKRLSMVHLISLEGLYGPEGASIWDIDPDVKTVRVVTLASWRFTCLDARHDFKGLLHHLNKEHLFSTDTAPADPKDPGKLSKALRAALKAHDIPVSAKAMLGVAPPRWDIHDTKHHFRLRAVLVDGALRVYWKQRQIARVKPDASDRLKGALSTRTLTALRKACAKLLPPLSLSKEATSEFLPADKWRVTDPDGPGYWVHQTDRGYDIHRALPHTLRLSAEHLQAARKRVEEGHVALPHALRQGNNSLSWYRGPFVPGAISAPLDDRGLPPDAPLSGDHLMRYDPRDGMYTASYAAAWQLGRLLTLQNQKVAVSLLNWKREHRQAIERTRAAASLEHLTLATHNQLSPEEISARLPQDVRKWFAGLALLKGLPFNYLVPNEDMLPPETLRFFQVDPYWVRCLHDGAFSVGRVSALDHARDQTHTSHRLTQPGGLVSGVLLRSELVSGWPDLAVEAYDSAIQHEDYETALQRPQAPIPAHLPLASAFLDGLVRGDGDVVGEYLHLSPTVEIEVHTVAPGRCWAINVDRNDIVLRVEQGQKGFDIFVQDQLPLLRMARLGPNLLLCLFAGDLKTLDIHQKPGALHFGFSHSDDAGRIRYFRELKSHIGTELPGCEVDVPFRPTPEGQGGNTINFRASETPNTEPPNGLAPDMKTSFHAISDTVLRTLATHSVGEDAEAITRFTEGFRKISDRPINSDQMALQLTEGVAKVRFVLGET